MEVDSERWVHCSVARTRSRLPSFSSLSSPVEGSLLLRILWSMAAPRVEDVIAFLTARGFSAAAAALRDDLLSSRSPGDAAGDLNLDLDLDVGSALPPLRLPPPSRGGGGEDALPSAASSSSDAFLSLGSSPSGTRSRDPGLWLFLDLGTRRLPLLAHGNRFAVTNALLLMTSRLESRIAYKEFIVS